MKLSETIKKIRTDKSISQAEMARRLNLERGNYSRLENRGDKLSVEQLHSIAQVLGVTIIEILTWGEVKPNPKTEADIAKDTEQLQERIKQLEEYIDILSEGFKMRRIAAKQLYEQYEDLLPLEEEETEPRYIKILRRTMVYIAVLAEIDEND